MPARAKSRTRSRIAVSAPRNTHGRSQLRGKQRQISSLWEAFEGARAGGYRGYWFVPGMQFDTARQMNQWTRDQLAGKNVWAYNNIPEVRAVIDGLAIDEVDTAIWPNAQTDNEKFNEAVTDRFDEENKDPRTFDLRQVDNAYSGQYLIRRTVRAIGDMFGQLVRPLTAGAPPRLGFIPGYQCSNRDAPSSDKLLREGVRFDGDTGAATHYRFALPKKSSDEKQRYREVEANDVLHFHDPFLSDQIRGISTLAPVTRQMFSMDDIDRAETAGQLLRSRIAYAVETQGAESGEIPRLPGVVDVEVIEHPDGTKTIIQKIMSKDGNQVDVFTPPSGMKIKTVESNRGGAVDFRNFLAKGLMYCTPYPPSWILELGGFSQGTDVRRVQNRVQKIANFYRAMQLDMQYMQRWYRYWLWQRIKAGIFDDVEGGIPFNWWKHQLVYPADMSVDLGRDGRLYDDRVMRGNMSPDDYHAKSGRAAKDVDKEILKRAFARKRMLIEESKKPENANIEVRFEEVWRPPPGTPAEPQSQLDPEEIPVGTSTAAASDA